MNNGKPFVFKSIKHNNVVMKKVSGVRYNPKPLLLTAAGSGAMPDLNMVDYA